ncbi:hypothetical protein ACFFHM_04405 [Halalkalibacter kiskunsagensis]|uniref:Uncharacterized protein n=1 Tax=Halalkalibacter kiskunsagensis TaxID=1548599 RepID=A0ABV6K914_9BACI
MTRHNERYENDDDILVATALETQVNDATMSECRVFKGQVEKC